MADQLNEWNTGFLLTINSNRRGSAVWFGEAINALLDKLLRSFRNWLDRTPPHGWHEIGWLDRTGRLLMIAAAFAIIGGPLCWLVLR
ncbi:MAG: hypothetical protein K2Z80_26395 [Xanthobacteraceae bacterium]|nr:hypothetical protein [Xanthobacteraceae bacterium]